jgi:hypothetical protein
MGNADSVEWRITGISRLGSGTGENYSPTSLQPMNGKTLPLPRQVSWGIEDEVFGRKYITTAIFNSMNFASWLAETRSLVVGGKYIRPK